MLCNDHAEITGTGSRSCKLWDIEVGIEALPEPINHITWGYVMYCWLIGLSYHLWHCLVTSCSCWHPRHQLGESCEWREAEAGAVRLGTAEIHHSSHLSWRRRVGGVRWRCSGTETEVSLSTTDGWWGTQAGCCCCCEFWLITITAMYSLTDKQPSYYNLTKLYRLIWGKYQQTDENGNSSMICVSWFNDFDNWQRHLVNILSYIRSVHCKVFLFRCCRESRDGPVLTCM